MQDYTRTTTAMLDGLFDSENSTVWADFDRRYRPILVGFSRRLGLSDADAADVAQETIARFVTEYRDGKYDRERARLRSWLVGIAKYRVLEIQRKRGVRKEARGESAIFSLSDEQTMTAAWDEERRSAVLRDAMERLRTETRTSPKTIEAFEMLMVRNQPVAKVAEQLEMSSHDVYLAKSRVAQKLRDIVSEMEKVYDGEF